MTPADIPDRAQAIAQQYRNNLPSDYAGRYAALADSTTLEMLFRAVEAGLNQRDSCAAAGIHSTTFQRWLERADAEPDGAFAAFASDLKACRAAGKLVHLENIKKHSAKEWTASAWTLERTDPEQFALRRDDSQTPKVIVQIGIRESEVQVTLAPSESERPALTPLLGEGQQKA